MHLSKNEKLTSLNNIIPYSFYIFKTYLYIHIISNYDLVIHFAAESHVDRSIESPAEFTKDNVLSTLNVLEGNNESVFPANSILNRKNVKLPGLPTIWLLYK
jgi:dTDP-D-glucose 4,6-dehydratase